MPTKVIDSDGSIRNWPTDFTEKIKDTIVGRTGFKDGEITGIAEKSAINTSIQFDNDAFVEEGLKILEGIEKEKILDLAKRGKPEPIMYRSLRRSRVFDEVKDFTLEDMRESDNLLKIIGYSLFGKVTEEEPEQFTGPYNLGEDYADTEQAQEYISSLRNIPQTRDFGADVPSLPSMFMKKPDFEPYFEINIGETSGLPTIEITSTGKDKSVLYFSEYNNTEERTKFLKRIYPNVNYRSTGKRILKSTESVSLSKLRGTHELNLSKVKQILTTGKITEDNKKDKLDDIKEIIESEMDSIVGRVSDELIKYLAEMNKADPLMDETYEVYITGMVKKIDPLEETKSFKYEVKIKSVRIGTFDISPFSKPTYQRTKGKGKSEITSEAISDRGLSDSESKILSDAIKEYNKIMNEAQTEIETEKEYEQKQKEALSELEDKLSSEESEGISMEVIQSISKDIEERYTKLKESRESSNREYRFNERLSDHIEEILDRFDSVKDEIEEGA